MMLRRLCMFGALGLLFGAGPQPAFGQQNIRIAPAAESFRIGTIQVSVLRDGRLAIPNDGSVFALNSTPANVADVLKRAGERTDTIFLDIDVLLVRSHGRIILIDCGYGPKGRGVLADSLKLLHLSPSDVTDILITHAHPDHVGGLIDAAGRSAFPHAIIHISANDWRFMNHEAETRDVAAAVRSQVRTFTPGMEVLPGIRSQALYGHTPGHVIYELVSNGERLLDTGDVAHSSIISLARPAWTIAWDSDKRLGVRQRIGELRRVAHSRERIFAVHFPFPGVGFIIPRGKGFAFAPNLPSAHGR